MPTGKDVFEASDVALLMLVFAALDGKIEGRKRLQKTVFLFKYLYNIPFNFTFRLYFYGPYSQKLAEVVETLKSTDLLQEKIEAFPRGFVRYNYLLSEEGKKLAEEVRTNVSSTGFKKIGEAAKAVSKIPTPELVVLSKNVLRNLPSES